MTDIDETPEEEQNNDVDQEEGCPEEGHPDEDSDGGDLSLVDDFKSTVSTPYRRTSIWNSPLGLAASVYIAVKLIDLTRDLVTKHIQAKEAELRRL